MKRWPHKVLEWSLPERSRAHKKAHAWQALRTTIERQPMGEQLVKLEAYHAEEWRKWLKGETRIQRITNVCCQIDTYLEYCRRHGKLNVTYETAEIDG